MASIPLSRNLEQLRGLGSVRRLEAGEEVHQPQGGGGPYLGSGPAFVPGRCATGGTCRAGQGKAKKSPAKATRRARAQKGAKEERTNKKAEVVAMMKRAKGATLAEIMEATSWQKHTVRGFVSLLGSKGGLKIESTKNAAGERSYRIAK
jgi:hypothetical protein